MLLKGENHLQTDDHKVSVILLTKNSASTVQKSIESIFKQTRQPDEVVVVDGNSSDGTLDVVKKYPVKLVSEPGLGFGYARNLGVKNASGDIVFFIDSDCYAEPDWINNALPDFDLESEIVGVTGLTRLWNEESGVARFLAYVGGRINMPTEKRTVKIAPTMNLALKHEVISNVGAFDDTLIRCEDTDLTYKISKHHKILYDPSVVVWFRGAPNLRVASRKCVRHFIGVGQLFAKHGLKSSFARFNLPIRGFLLIAAVLSIFFLPWYVPTILFSIFLAEFVYKSVRLYLRYRDSCVIYYVAFFTLWSLVSLAMFYGLYLGWKNKTKIAAN
jgi:glycosyltransferase involved in cell wall biosynthesis